MPLSPLHRLAAAIRALRMRLERARLATRILELRDLLDVPHDVADAAGMRIERLARRVRALDRLRG